MTDSIDVLVVGAGPTGLTMASELLRRGAQVRIVDKADAPTTLSKAIAMHARTLELFDDMGIADEMVARGVALHGATMWAGNEEIAQVDFNTLDTRFPYVLSISQVETETVLAAAVRERGGRIERSTELVALDSHGDESVATLRTPRGEERVRARFIVGCDGAHSAVRKAIGGTFQGHTYEDTFVLADVKLAAALPFDRISTFFGSDGIAACFPMRGERFRVVATATTDVAGGAAPTIEGLERALTARIGRDVKMTECAWLAPFRIHCRQVERYREGNVFLAGDAAHIHSPAGGQGMNTGIQDAHNLAWKLALALRGKARDALLDSYHHERHAVGHTLLFATDLATKLSTLKSATAAELRNHVARFVAGFEPIRHRMARQLAELTVGYEASPIVEERIPPMLTTRVGAAAAGESPTVGSRLAFRMGPRAGARAPDGIVRRAGDTSATLLSRILDGIGFTLLLFDGRCDSVEGYDALAAIARHTRESWNMPTWIVVRGDERPPSLPEDLAVLLDVEGQLEERYAASTECLYLVRPDLYVGFRSMPADGAALNEHLESIVVA